MQAALLRALISRARVRRDRILLTDVESVDWGSLTFTGERHLLQLRVAGPDSKSIVERMCAGLDDAEFSISGTMVADITAAAPEHALDRSASVRIEALTVAED